MPQDERISIRVDAYTRMQLEILSELTGCNVSVVIRMLIMKGLAELTDDEGNVSAPAIRGTSS